MKRRSKSDLSILLDESFETYYWIGFLMADGYVNHKTNRLKLNLQKKDEKSVLSFAKYIKCKNFRIELRSGREYADVKTQDVKFIPSIIKKYDFKPRKTYNPPNLSYLNNNDDFFWCFLIGFIDGDGSILKRKGKEEYKITIKLHKNWYENLLFLGEKTKKIINLNSVCVYKYGNVSILSFNNYKILKFLKAKTIEFKLPVLHRKWDIIDELRESKLEKYERNKETIKNMLDGEHTINEISDLVGLTYSRTLAITKELIIQGNGLKTKRDMERNDLYKRKMQLALVGKNSGEKHGMSKLTKEIVLEIRKTFSEKTMSMNKLAKKYNVCKETIRSIVNYKTWNQI